MASSSENLMSNFDPLAFMRPSLNDYWLSDLFSRDTETLTLTRALQKSLEPALTLTQTPTPTVSGLSGSDPETPTPVTATASASEATTPKRHRNGVAGGKITKRKSRATKRSQTTFITADAANFRQMVQQVTGVRFGGAALAQFSAPIIKPEPLRGFGSAAVGARFPLGGGGGCPPTLDTSALLLDQDRAATPVAVSPAEEMTCQAFSVTPFISGPGLDFDAIQSFPTLESWKVL